MTQLEDHGNYSISKMNYNTSILCSMLVCMK